MAQDGWANPSASEAAEMAAFLETRPDLADQAAVDRALLDVLAPAPGERLLEVGSGSGLLCRQAARRMDFSGWVTGLDVSLRMAAEAQRRITSISPAASLCFTAGRAEALPHPSGIFDLVFAARLLLHVAHPEPVVAGMVRVARPGGRVALMDWDFGTVAVDHPNRELTRRLLEWRCDYYSGNNWSGRQLLGLAVGAGLGEVQVEPVVLVARGEADGFTQSLWRAAQRACEAGVITLREQAAWQADLRERIAVGRFFASITYFIVQGRKG